MKHVRITFIYLLIVQFAFSQQKPNVIYIYADDLGYGDVSYNGATKLHTPNTPILKLEIQNKSGGLSK